MKCIVNTAMMLLLGTTVGYAASLQVYQNSAVYEYTPKSHYLGMVEHATATCKGQPLSLQHKTECEEGDRLCKAYNDLLLTKQKLSSLDKNIKLLDQIVSLHKPTSFDPVASMEAATKISQESARLDLENQKVKQELQLQTQAYMKQTRAKYPLYFSENCKVPTKLTFGYGKVSFNSYYEAELSKENEIEVTQYLAITNRSGLDMRAKSAMFYHRPAQRYIRPVHFNPWIVSEYQPQEKRMSYADAVPKKAMMEANLGMAAPVVEVAAPVATYVDAREYKITNLDLPSTGVPVNVAVTSWKTPLTCGIHVSPYSSTTVYEKCTFTPQKQIDNNSWKIKEGDVTINDRAVGEYRDKKYDLYTKVEEDIQVTRKPVVTKEKETGFFGGTARKKDGYTITLINKSDKKKALTITERIPTSTTEKIEVKLLSVTSDKNVNYKKLKDGKIEIYEVLAPGQSKKIKVMFEMSYDKDLKINY